MELKCLWTFDYLFRSFGFNRTFMELKFQNRQRRSLCVKQGGNAETERGYSTVSTTKGRVQASSLRGFGWMMAWVYAEKK